MYVEPGSTQVWNPGRVNSRSEDMASSAAVLALAPKAGLCRDAEGPSKTVPRTKASGARLS